MITGTGEIRVDSRIHGPYRRRPLNSLIRKPPMTVVVGMICEDGIVLASDTMFRVGDDVTYGEKIYPLVSRPWLKLAVGGAGHANFIRAAKDKFDLALPSSPASLEDVRTIIESTNKAFYEDHVLTHPNPEYRPYYGLLVAVSHKTGGQLLLHSSENVMTQVKEIELEGTGGITAEPYKGLWRENIPAFEAELAATFMVKYAKTYDAQNCGGDSRLFALYGHRLFQLDQGYIRSAEGYFEQFLKSSLELLLPLDVDPELDEEFFVGEVRGVYDDLRHRRADLRRWHPHAYQLLA